MYSNSASAVVRGLLITVLVMLSACADDPGSPEQQVRDALQAMETAVEEGSIKDAAALLHADYRDSLHSRKREAVASLFAYLRRHRSIHLFTVVRSVDLAADARHAEVVAYVAMGGVPMDSVETAVSVKADLYRFDVQLVQGEDDWLITRARWQRAPAELFAR